MNESFTALIQQEESKRRRSIDPQSQWKFIQNVIAWADSQATVRRNTKEACLAHQRRLLAQFAGAQTDQH